MEYRSNKDKILEAVLLDEELQKLGNYNLSSIQSIYAAAESDNYIVKAVATIIIRAKDNSTMNETYKEINNYLKSRL